MKLKVLFVFLEYLIGFGFAMAGVFIFSEHDRSALNTSIIYSLIVGFICMFLGIVLVGYFHLGMMGIKNRFVNSIFNTFAGLFLSFLLCFLIADFLAYLGFLAFFIPLSGGVIGFNWTLSKEKQVV